MQGRRSFPNDVAMSYYSTTSYTKIHRSSDLDRDLETSILEQPVGPSENTNLDGEQGIHLPRSRQYKFLKNVMKPMELSQVQKNHSSY